MSTDLGICTQTEQLTPSAKLATGQSNSCFPQSSASSVLPPSSCDGRESEKGTFTRQGDNLFATFSGSGAASPGAPSSQTLTSRLTRFLRLFPLTFFVEEDIAFLPLLELLALRPFLRDGSLSPSFCHFLAFKTTEDSSPPRTLRMPPRSGAPCSHDPRKRMCLPAAGSEIQPRSMTLPSSGGPSRLAFVGALSRTKVGAPESHRYVTVAA
mmetsp:Transcript_44471/g.135557  ORF Transcript_44471/g.135557 Transcript_44471/m.135557 type:complete len:211 (+) Transcript_44471:539-1171(+)